MKTNPASNPEKNGEVRKCPSLKGLMLFLHFQVGTSRRLDQTGDAIAAKASRELLSRGLVTTPKDTQKWEEMHVNTTKQSLSLAVKLVVALNGETSVHWTMQECTQPLRSLVALLLRLNQF